jgi:hypothetical protein
MSKVVLLFLIFIMVLGIFGKLRLPKLPTFKRNKGVEDARKCESCGAFLFKGVDCGCKNNKGSKRK